MNGLLCRMLLVTSSKRAEISMSSMMGNSFIKYFFYKRIYDRSCLASLDRTAVPSQDCVDIHVDHLLRKSAGDELAVYDVWPKWHQENVHKSRPTPGFESGTILAILGTQIQLVISTIFTVLPVIIQACRAYPAKAAHSAIPAPIPSMHMPVTAWA
jgi:hypothetical protein